jgi:hypothetical protein
MEIFIRLVAYLMRSMLLHNSYKSMDSVFETRNRTEYLDLHNFELWLKMLRPESSAQTF